MQEKSCHSSVAAGETERGSFGDIISFCLLQHVLRVRNDESELYSILGNKSISTSESIAYFIIFYTSSYTVVSRAFKARHTVDIVLDGEYVPLQTRPRRSGQSHLHLEHLLLPCLPLLLESKRTKVREAKGQKSYVVGGRLPCSCMH